MPVTPMTAQREYEKNPDIKKEDIVALQQWMEKEPHLPKIAEVQLILFYQSCENSMELTKSTIETYYTLRTQFDQYFLSRDPRSAANKTVCERVLAVPLPELTPEGYKVFYCRLLDYEPSHILYQTAAKLFMMVSDLVQQEQGTYPGVVILIDLAHLVLGHLTRVSITDVKYSVQYLQEAMPVRLKGIHILNCPSFMDTIMNMVKPFLNKHLIEVLKLHPVPADTLYKYVPQKMMPKEFGGGAPSFEELRDTTSAWLCDNHQYFADEEKIRCDESKRQGKPKSIDGGFGVDGSFKKLNLD